MNKSAKVEAPLPHPESPPTPRHPPHPERLLNRSVLRFYLKRSTDLVLATLLLILLWPLFLLIALLIRLGSAGPILFVQERVGARGRVVGERVVWEVVSFRLYKFRSMVHHADPTLHEDYIRAFVTARAEGAAPPEGFKLVGDPRITRVGRWLRRTSLDELPQLFNVLRGEMSLVGPRPVPLYEAAAYRGWQRERLLARPGITGVWQVKGRGRVSCEEMLWMDITYVRHPSLRRDVELLLATIPAVWSGRGAR